MIDYEKETLSGNLTSLSVENQFFLFLAIFKRGKTFQEASYLFGVSVNTTSRVFRTWLQYHYCKFKDLQPYMIPRIEDWPSRPAVFQNSFLKDVTFVVDCSEIHIQSSSNYDQQGHMYSDYKSGTTGKILNVNSPHGSALWVSDVYEGSIRFVFT